MNPPILSPTDPSMKAYLLTTALAFALIVLAHALRIVEEGVHVAAAPIFLVTTLASVGMCAWAIVLVRRLGAGGARGDD